MKKVIREMLSKRNLLNPDGTTDLYHATIRERAKKILSEGFLRKSAHMPGVYLSTSPKIAEEYGDGTTLLRIRVRAEDLRLDDSFLEIDRAQRDRDDFSIRTSGGKYAPISISPIKVKLPRLPKNMVRIAVKWNDKIYSVKPGQKGIANHEGLFLTYNIPFEDGAISGFISKKGEFVGRDRGMADREPA